MSRSSALGIVAPRGWLAALCSFLGGKIYNQQPQAFILTYQNTRGQDQKACLFAEVTSVLELSLWFWLGYMLVLDQPCCQRDGRSWLVELWSRALSQSWGIRLCPPGSHSKEGGASWRILGGAPAKRRVNGGWAKTAKAYNFLTASCEKVRSEQMTSSGRIA